jgi:hypothetical protein
VGLLSRRRPADRVLLVDADRTPVPDHSAVLLRVVAEAVILQDEAEAVLAAVGRHEHLGLVAPRGGPLVHRFFQLRDRLPRHHLDPSTARRTAQLDTILLHHAMQVATALDFLAVEGRSERMAAHVDAIQGLGAPAQLLDGIYAELKVEVTAGP